MHQNTIITSILAPIHIIRIIKHIIQHIIQINQIKTLIKIVKFISILRYMVQDSNIYHFFQIFDY